MERADSETATGKIANYAQYEDYHQFIKERLFDLTSYISSLAERDLKFKICVDSAPLAERALAARAGLGFIGIVARRAFPDAGSIEEAEHPVGRLRADTEPML